MLHPKSLRNNYLGMRHGRSQANVKNIIVSSLEQGRQGQWGLSPAGRGGVKQSVLQAQKAKLIDSQTRLWVSPFSRTIETAEIVAKVMKSNNPLWLDVDLIERYFGGFDGQNSCNYKKVWESDSRQLPPDDKQVETVQQVLARLLKVIERIEYNLSGQSILLVSHGDPLQILATWFKWISPWQHRSLPAWDTAGIKKFN